MNKDRFWELISLKLSGEAQTEELAELEALLQAYPEESLRLETLYTIWDTHNTTQPGFRKEAFNRHMQRLSNHLSEPVLLYENAAEDEYPEIPKQTGK